MHEEGLRTFVWLLCRKCGEPYSSDQGQAHAVVLGSGPDSCAGSYADHPYNWSAVNGYCLACWLGVGPSDFPGTGRPPARN